MALFATIALVVILAAVRLLMPPVPGLIQASFRKLGKRATVILCAISIVGAVLVILVSTW